MNEWNVFLVIGTVFAFIGTSYTLFYKPTHELKVEIVKLNANFDAINKRDEQQNKRLDAHSKKLDEHDKKIDRIDYDLKYYIKDRV